MNFIMKIKNGDLPQKDINRGNNLLALRTFITTLATNKIPNSDRKKWIKKVLKRLFLSLFLMLFTQCNNNQPQLIVYENNYTDVEITNLKFEGK